MEEINCNLDESVEAMKRAEALEIQARKMRETAFSNQRKQLEEKQKLLQKKELV